MSDVVARAKAALEDVTDGPWMAGKGGPGYSNWVDSKPDRSLVNIEITGCVDNLADAEFIAAARSLVPELLAEVEKLRHAMETIQIAASVGVSAAAIGNMRGAVMRDALGAIHDTIGALGSNAGTHERYS